MKYIVHIEDCVDYFIPDGEADNHAMAEDLALEFWAERMPTITITPVEE